MTLYWTTEKGQAAEFMTFALSFAIDGLRMIYLVSSSSLWTWKPPCILTSIQEPGFVKSLLQCCVKVMRRDFNKIAGFSGLFKAILLETIFQGNFQAFSYNLLFWFAWLSNDDSLLFEQIRFSRDSLQFFKQIIQSFRKFDLLFINRPGVFSKHSSLSEIYEWQLHAYCRHCTLSNNDIFSRIDTILFITEQ